MSEDDAMTKPEPPRDQEWPCTGCGGKHRQSEGCFDAPAPTPEPRPEPDEMRNYTYPKAGTPETPSAPVNGWADEITRLARSIKGKEQCLEHARQMAGETPIPQQLKCWLIEGGGVYWCGRGVDDFWPDVHEAVKFADQVAAERVLHWMLPEQYHRTCRATEHIYGL